MAELPPLKENKYWKGVFAVVGIMSTLVIYGVLQAAGDISPYSRGRDSTIWGVSLMIGYLGLILQGHLLMAVDFVTCHNDCFFDIALFSILHFLHNSNFGALTFATIMTTSDKTQLVSVLLSCIWFAHPLRWEQCIGAVIVFGSLYVESFLNNKPRKSSHPEHSKNGESSPLNGNP